MTKASKIVLAAIVAMAMCLALAAPAFAGSPHFVGTAVVSVSGNTLSVSAKEAGLGDEDQIHVELDATAECINPGDHHPRASNKESLSTAADVPVQNGKSNYTLSVTNTISPSCSPPMTIVWVNVTLTDTTNGISQSFPGPFSG